MTRSATRSISDCRILENEEVAPGQYRMRLHGPEIARSAVPGQFCMIQIADGLYPFLRRPMCFERITDEAFNILYKVEGEGTEMLSRYAAGRCLSIQGPLGKGFPIDAGYDRHIIVAGGIGVATFPALAEALVNELDEAPQVIIAARSKHLILCEYEFRGMGCEVHIATDDGSRGERAFACDMLARLNPDARTRVYACGPMIMMKTTSDTAVAGGASCLVSLEARMACGDGACLGCVVESKTESEGERMVRVCLDGPVFDTRSIDWEAHDLAYAP